jgi:hypothetical protein
LVAGKLMRHASGLNDPLRKAEYLSVKYTKEEEDHEAVVRRLLQGTFYVRALFRHQPREFERLQAHKFWKQPEAGPKPRDPATSEGILRLIMRATTTTKRKLASKYAAILEGLEQEQVDLDAVAARIKELGGIEAAYETLRTRMRPRE